MLKYRFAIIFFSNFLLLNSCSAMQQSPKRNTASHIPQAEKQEFADELVAILRANYVKESTIVSNEALLKKELLLSLDKDHGTKKEELSKDLTATLRRIIADKHLGVRPKNLSTPEEQNASRLAWMEKVRYGIEKVQVENNVGYLKLTHFVWPRNFSLAKQSGIALKNYVHEAFSQLNDAKALIIDLRDNEGGSPEMVSAIASFILQPGLLLNEFHWRDPRGTMYEFLSNSEICFDNAPDSIESPVNGITVEKFKTIDTGIVFGIESKLREVPVAVLINSRTFSAGEEFAYNMKQTGRAVLIGETTAGGANPWHPVALKYGLEFAIPNCEAKNPLSGTNWEGKGIEPDVKVSSDEAFEAARAMLLSKIDTSFKTNRGEERALIFDYIEGVI